MYNFLRQDNLKVSEASSGGADNRRFSAHQIERLISALLLLTLSTAAQALIANPTTTEFIHIAASLPLSGSQSERGTSIRQGLLVATRDLNARGGIGGHQVQLEILDDTGDPAKAGQNIARLVSDKNVTAIVGCLGEASCLSVAQEAKRTKQPLLGAISVDSAVCNSNSLAFCLHASYADEAEVIASQIKTQGLQSIILLISPKFLPYSTSINKIFEYHGITSTLLILPEEQSGANKVLKKTLQITQTDNLLAVTMLLENEAAVTATRQLRQGNPRVQIAAFSTIEPFLWLHHAREWSKGIIVANSIPDPDLQNLPITKQYQRAMELYAERYFPFSHDQLEAFMTIRLFELVAKQLVPGDIRSRFSTKIEQQGLVDLDGHLLRFSNQRRLGALKANLYIVGKKGLFIE